MRPLSTAPQTGATLMSVVVIVPPALASSPSAPPNSIAR